MCVLDVCTLRLVGMFVLMCIPESIYGKKTEREKNDRICTYPYIRKWAGVCTCPGSPGCMCMLVFEFSMSSMFA